MFLDRELREIRKTKEILAVRCEVRRNLAKIDVLSMKSRILDAFSALRAGAAAAAMVKDLLTRRGDREG